MIPIEKISIKIVKEKEGYGLSAIVDNKKIQFRMERDGKVKSIPYRSPLDALEAFSLWLIGYVVYENKNQKFQEVKADEQKPDGQS